MHSPHGTVRDNHFLLRADSRYHPAYTSIRVTYSVLQRYVTHTACIGRPREQLLASQDIVLTA